jgi:SEC-C motif-containing protein
MRSRFTAFVLGDSAYLLASWHPSTRPVELDLGDDATEWQGLTILSAEAGMQGDIKGVVEFAARYCRQEREGVLHERSRFLFETGKWFYLDGDIQPDKPSRTGRNAPCPCGSGKKYKRCCGAS